MNVFLFHPFREELSGLTTRELPWKPENSCGLLIAIINKVDISSPGSLNCVRVRKPLPVPLRCAHQTVLSSVQSLKLLQYLTRPLRWARRMLALRALNLTN